MRAASKRLDVPPDDRRSRAEEILRDLGAQPRLTVYLGYSPGGGKSHRLLTEARALRDNLAFASESSVNLSVAVAIPPTQYWPPLKSLRGRATK